jgi:Tfp pilus assembly protein PilF
MAKFASEDVFKVAERLQSGRKRDRPAHFLIGAGCSISAGIPSATDLIKKIHEIYRTQCAALSDDQRNSYGACMALLTVNERRDLIRPYLTTAKINWGTIALAQLILEGFVERVLTLNFDLVLENACLLLGLQPAVYDFGIAPAGDPTKIVSPAIVHLHGQSYGLVLLNTDDETHKHRKKLRPTLLHSLSVAPLVVIGYSGSADGISRTLLKEFKGNEPLYWAGYADELGSHLRGFLKKEHFHFVAGADFDRFMIELAKSLECWPPRLFADPIGHLLDGLIEKLNPLVSYPIADSDGAIDIMHGFKRDLELLRRKDQEQRRTASLLTFYMKSDFEHAAMLCWPFPAEPAVSDEEREIINLSFIGWGSQLSEQAKKATAAEAERLFATAAEKFETALAIKPNTYEALHSWSNMLRDQAVGATGKEASRLFAAADGRYAETLAIKPASDDALNNWGNLLLEWAKRISGEEASRLFAAAEDKYKAALAIKPDKYEVLSNWGNLLSEQAQRAAGEEALQLLVAASDKYAAAIAVKPDFAKAFDNWGSVLLDRARRSSDQEASRLLAEAAEKLSASVRINPSRTYNLACLAALQGDEERCRQNLEHAEKCGTLPSNEYLVADPDLETVKKKPWFQKLLGRRKG